MLAGTPKDLDATNHKVARSFIVEGVEPDKTSPDINILPEVKRSTISEGLAGHLFPLGVAQSDSERIHEDHTPALGKDPLKLYGIE